MFPDLFRDDVFTLETRRLFLRWPHAKDAARLVAVANDPDIAGQMASWPHPFTLRDAEERIVKTRALNLSGNGVSLAIVQRINPTKVIGMAGLKRGAEGTLDFGYLVDKPHWGQGFMTEAAQALIDAAFLYSEAEAITAGIRVTNNASRKVLERCGFQYEGGGMCNRSAWGDSVSSDNYRLGRTTWASLKGWRAPLPGRAEAEKECA